MTREEAFAAAIQDFRSFNCEIEKQYHFSECGTDFSLYFCSSLGDFVYVGIISGGIALTSKCVSISELGKFLAVLSDRFSRNSRVFARTALLYNRRSVLVDEIFEREQELEKIDDELFAKEMAKINSQDAKLLASAGF